MQEHVFEDIGFFDLAFLDGHDRLIAGVCGGTFGEFESGLIEIDAHNGEIRWSELLGGIGVTIACHPRASEVAIGYEGSTIRFYDSRDWNLIREHHFNESDDVGGLCSLAYSNDGKLLAYGLSSGEFDIVETVR